MRPDFRYGRIVITQLTGRNGKREEHPAVIVSPDQEIIQPEHFDPRLAGGNVASNLIGVMGVSSKYRHFNDPYIQLPVGFQTGLTKDSAAILNWYAVLDIPDDCDYLLGDVPPAPDHRCIPKASGTAAWKDAGHHCFFAESARTAVGSWVSGR